MPSVPSRGASGEAQAIAADRAEAERRWVAEVEGPFLSRRPEARTALLKLLRDVMVHHRKEDLELPRPIFRHGEVSVPVPSYLLELADNELGVAVNAPRELLLPILLQR